MADVDTTRPLAEAGGLEIRRQRQPERPWGTQKENERVVTPLPIVRIEHVLDVKTRDQRLTFRCRVIECVTRAEIETSPFWNAASGKGRVEILRTRIEHTAIDRETACERKIPFTTKIER